ncbi:MAG: hypothetical protein IID08_10705 [Candidatus Hydrogenedentes bacterium]|nr:hypothetical protein [Candidatus Hydrogenedentota bacterium]
MAEERKIEFTGTGFQFLGWGLLAVSLQLLVIPTAWGAVPYYRWFVRSLKFSNGTEATFEGKAGQLWGLFALAALLEFAPQISLAVDDPLASFVVSMGLLLLLMPITVAIGLKILKWFFSNIKLSSGTELSFKGEYLTYLGWMLLLSVSGYTIIGWAWASTALIRWVCRNVDAGQSQIEFLGSGWGLLWRVFLACLASIFIIPIPWVWLWLLRWFMENMLISQKTA